MAEIEGAPTRRGPTLRDVARRAQVSVATHIVIRTSARPLTGGSQV